jgi:hypothetical protein
VNRREAALVDELEPTTPTRERGAEPLPGYRLLEPLGTGGFGEVWKCEVPGGLCKAIKFVNGTGYELEEGHSTAEQELSALQRIKAIRHPFILSVERAEVVDGELVIVTELADKSLRDVLDECRRTGLPGIPRATLLGLLAEAAEALDVMNFRYGLQHLDVKPGNLFLVSEHLKVADFGQVDTVSGSQPGESSRPRGTFTPLYAAPEILQGTITPHSDQYSLAVVYQELLTGTLPFTGKNSRQLLLQRSTQGPNLDALPAGDRPVVARALAKDPEKRFRSCLEFVRALLAVRDEAPDATEAEPAHPAVRRRPPSAQRSPAVAPAQALPVPPLGQRLAPAPAPRAAGAGREPGRAVASPPGRRTVGTGSKQRAGKRDRADSKPRGAERRVSVRYTWKSETRARVRTRPSYRCADVQLRDISALGVGLVFPYELEAGTSLFVQLPGRRQGTTTTHLAEVVHVVAWEEGSWLVGCKWARALSERDLRQALGEAP